MSPLGWTVGSPAPMGLQPDTLQVSSQPLPNTQQGYAHDWKCNAGQAMYKQTAADARHTAPDNDCGKLALLMTADYM